MTSVGPIRAFALAAALIFGTVAISAPASAAGDPAQGETVFMKCGACHPIEAGQKKVGPSFAGLYGRPAGTLEGYNYSADMIAAGDAGLVWNAETLAAYIKKEGQMGPKTYIGEVIGKKRAKIRMAFPGLAEDQDIADLIAYLETSPAAGQ